jgi:hypothetical protein
MLFGALIDCTPSLPQHQILADLATFASRKRCTACAASHVVKRGLRAGLDCDDVIERLAIQASERAER